MQILVSSLFLILLFTGVNTHSNDALQIGDVAPDWVMTGSDGNQYNLSKFKGEKIVVVAWYPMALTGG